MADDIVIAGIGPTAFGKLPGREPISLNVETCRNALADDNAFKNRPPYNVAIVELDEGPRLITNIVDADNAALAIDLPVTVAIEDEHGAAIPRFRLA